jgi:hypothetical protein
VPLSDTANWQRWLPELQPGAVAGGQVRSYYFVSGTSPFHALAGSTGDFFSITIPSRERGRLDGRMLEATGRTLLGETVTMKVTLRCTVPEGI